MPIFVRLYLGETLWEDVVKVEYAMLTLFPHFVTGEALSSALRIYWMNVNMVLL